MKKTLSIPCLFPVLLIFLGFSSVLSAEPESNLREGYRLRVGDVLDLSIYRESDLARVLVIGRGGKVSLELIEQPVHLEGLTRAQATERIREIYLDGYLKNPTVNLTVTQYAQESVGVSGQVNKPGGVPIPDHGKLDLLAAMTNAGWLTALADPKHIELQTAADGKSTIYSVEDIRGGRGSRLLQPGDQVIAHISRFALDVVSVQGEVNLKGNVSIPNDGKLELATVIENAGGPTPLADLSSIKLTRGARDYFYSYAEIRNGKAGKVLLQGGDRVYLKVSPYVGASVSILGAVNKSGPVPLPVDGKLHLMQAISLAGDFSDLANRKKVILSRPGQQPFEYDTKKLAEQGKLIWLLPDDVVTVKERWF